jgi:hypothetical protein
MQERDAGQTHVRKSASAESRRKKDRGRKNEDESTRLDWIGSDREKSEESRRSHVHLERAKVRIPMATSTAAPTPPITRMEWPGGLVGVRGPCGPKATK